MSSWVCRAAVAAACVALPALARAQSSPGAVAITGVTVIPMDRETRLAEHTVVVRDGAIAAVGPTRTTRVPAGATVIDGRGKFLIPGLADMHVHLAGPMPLQHALLKMFVVNGVTTVLNMRGAPEHLALRADIERGAVLGPRVFTVGPHVNEPFVRTPDEVERAVREQRAAGYDFVKMHGDLTRDAYARLNQVGREVGIRIIGHAPRNLGIEALFEERQYALAHAEEFIYDRNGSSRDYLSVVPRFPALAKSMVETGTWLMPNLIAFKMIGAQLLDLDGVLARPEMRYFPSAYRNGWRADRNPYTTRNPPMQGTGIMERLKALQTLTGVFQQQGVSLLAGTDALNPGTVPGFSIHDELEELVIAGLTPYQALRAATANAARFIGAAGGAGTVTAGARGDLLLLSADPLRTITNSRRVEGVMLRGRFLDRKSLDAMLQDLSAM